MYLFVCGCNVVRTLKTHCQVLRIIEKFQKKKTIFFQKTLLSSYMINCKTKYLKSNKNHYQKYLLKIPKDLLVFGSIQKKVSNFRTEIEDY